MKKKILVSLLTAIFIFLSIPFYSLYSINADDGTEGQVFFVNNFAIKLNNPDSTPLSDEMLIKNGDKLKITFNWTIKNTDVNNNTFIYNLNEIAININILDIPKNDLFNINGDIN